MGLADASPKTLSNHLPERSHDNKREVRAPAMPSADILRSLTHQARRSGSGAPPRARRNPKVALPSKLLDREAHLGVGSAGATCGAPLVTSRLARLLATGALELGYRRAHRSAAHLLPRKQGATLPALSGREATAPCGHKRSRRCRQATRRGSARWSAIPHCRSTPEAIAPGLWLLSPDTSRAADAVTLMLVRGSSGRADCCFDDARATVGRLLGGPQGAPELAPHNAAATTAAPGGAKMQPTWAVGVEPDRLVVCRGDAVGGRARRDRWLSSRASMRSASRPATGRAEDTTRHVLVSAPSAAGRSSGSSPSLHKSRRDGPRSA
jgi:hypothetical protein